jgi:hypothetical protein
MGTELSKIHMPAGARGGVTVGNSVLSELGITKRQSSEWQSIALVPPVDIEEYINARRKEEEPVSKAAIIAIADNYKSAGQITREESDKLVMLMNAYCIQARKLIGHLQKYEGARQNVSKDFFETIKLLEKITDELNRATM